MPSLLNPYLNFRKTARQAMEFYRDVFGGELTLATYGSYNMARDPSENDHIMHAMLTAPNGFVLMAADLPDSMEFVPGTNMSVSLSGDESGGLRAYWDKLSEGANVTMPLAAAPWGDSFGALVDKFGTRWLINIAGTQA